MAAMARCCKPELLGGAPALRSRSIGDGMGDD
jgi:hypothetical protein